MKRTWILTLVLLMFAGIVSAGEKGLKWRDFNDGLAEAKKSNRKVLVDVYTDWCSWCKKMDAQTYADTRVTNYLNKKYVVVKLNAEANTKVRYKGTDYTARELSAAFGITGFPSTLFLGADGEPITIYPGFADAERFHQVLSFIAEDHYLKKNFAEYIGGK